MLKEWLNKNLSFGEKYLSVEAILHGEESVTLNAVLFTKKKQDFVAERQLIDTDATAIKRMAGTDFPLLLSVSGKGIVVKNLGATDREQVNLTQVFPNANADDFLFQSAVVGQNVYISVLRRNIFDQVFADLSNVGFKIVASFIGPVSIAYAAPAISPAVNHFQSAAYAIQLKEGGELESKPLTESRSLTYYYGQSSISSDLFQPLAAVLAYRGHRTDFSLPEHQGLQAFAVDEGYRRRFETIARIGLVVLLGLLIINRLLSYEFTREYAELEVRQALLTGETQESSELKKELEIKKELAKAAGLNQSQPASFYSDQVGALIPEDISLTELAVFPLSASGKQGQPQYDYKTLKVSGKTLESSSISQLVKDLNRLDWTANAVIDKITDDDGVLSFIILISVRA
ncbi:MAG: hypothetical protein V4616_08545 [Bacteroidota bacterium]